MNNEDKLARLEAFEKQFEIYFQNKGPHLEKVKWLCCELREAWAAIERAKECHKSFCRAFNNNEAVLEMEVSEYVKTVSELRKECTDKTEQLEWHNRDE